MRSLVVFLISISALASLLKLQFRTDRKLIIDPRLKPYLLDWCHTMEQAGIPYQERLRSIHSITLENFDEGSTQTGLTYIYSRKVKINLRYIDRNPCAVRATFYHELGHAAFNLPHDCCSIMNSKTNPNEQNYCAKWKSYLNDYVRQCKKYQVESCVLIRPEQ